MRRIEMAKYTLYAKKVYYYRKDINAQDRKSAEKRSDQYESERLFIPTGEEFYITSIEENEDAV
jgi:hypothetical protein